MMQPYLNAITTWATNNNLIVNASKTQSTLFTLEPVEYFKSLKLKINDITLTTNPFPKILGKVKLEA